MNNAQEFINAVFGDIAPNVPSDARFNIMATAECYPGRYVENVWQPLPDMADMVTIDDDPEESEYVGSEQMVIHHRLDHYNLTIDQLYSWVALNLLDDPESWSTNNGGIITGDGLLPCANAVDIDPMYWNVGGITPVCGADATIYPSL